MGQLCVAMTATATAEDDGHREAQILHGVRHTKCFSGHATRSTAVQCSYMLPTLERMIDRKPALRLLDVGCGCGDITTDFALKAPRGAVIGLDLSGAVLETAKVHAQQQGATNVTFMTGNVHRLLFADGTFDVVHTHQSVAHFADPAQAIRELVRVTKKGGVLCMREGDLRTARFCPELPLLEECFKLIVEVHKLNGGDADAASKLHAWAIEAGAKKVTTTRSKTSYSTLEERRDYGGMWPARCNYGAFADLAMRMGTQR